MLFDRPAQTLNEYAIVIAIITLSIMGINTYLKRGIQNAIKSTADDLGSSASGIYKIQSQTLGFMESGLVEYSGSTNIVLDKKTKLLALPQAAPNPVRTNTIVKDNSVSTGSWTAIYKLGDSESFGAKEKAKKQPGNKLDSK